MEDFKNNKIERVLGIYTKLMNGYLVSKAEESVNYGFIIHLHYDRLCLFYLLYDFFLQFLCTPTSRSKFYVKIIYPHIFR